MDFINSTTLTQSTTIMEEQERIGIETALKKLKLDLTRKERPISSTRWRRPFMLPEKHISDDSEESSAQCQCGGGVLQKASWIKIRRKNILHQAKFILPSQQGGMRKDILRKSKLKLSQKQVCHIIENLNDKKTDNDAELAAVFGTKLCLPKRKNFQSVITGRVRSVEQKFDDENQLSDKLYSALAFKNYRLMKNSNAEPSKKEVEETHTGVRSCSEEARKTTVEDSSVTDLTVMFRDNMCIMSHMAEMMYT